MIVDIYSLTGRARSRLFFGPLPLPLMEPVGAQRGIGRLVIGLQEQRIWFGRLLFTILVTPFIENRP